jgi:hypothetical protein
MGNPDIMINLTEDISDKLKKCPKPNTQPDPGILGGPGPELNVTEEDTFVYDKDGNLVIGSRRS